MLKKIFSLRVIVAISILAAYWFLTLVGFALFGRDVFAFSPAPVLIAAWLYGIWDCVAIAFFVIVMNASIVLNVEPFNLHYYTPIALSVITVIILIVIVTGRLRDIRAIHRMPEILLSREKETLKKYLDLTGIIVLALDTGGNVEMINKIGCEILGLPADRIIGRNWFDNFLPGRVKEQVRKFFDSIIGGDLKTYEYAENPIKTADGNERAIAWHNNVLRDENGHIISVICTGEDITEKKRASEDLGAKINELERMNKVSVDREDKIIELKKQLEEMKAKQGSK